MEAKVTLVVWVLIATQIIPASWILRGQDKESPSKNKVLLLSLGLLGLEAAMLGLISGVVSAWDDPAEMIAGAGLLFLCAGGLGGASGDYHCAHL